jgi:hypothetical protein
MTWEFFIAYGDEAYAVVSEEWLSANKLTPTGFSLVDLMGDIKGLQ